MTIKPLTKDEREKLISSLPPRDSGVNAPWWEPVVYTRQEMQWFDSPKLAFLCDHLGEAQEKMECMWAEIVYLRGIIDKIP